VREEDRGGEIRGEAAEQQLTEGLEFPFQESGFDV
jgi:hypothetical protein